MTHAPILTPGSRRRGIASRRRRWRRPPSRSAASRRVADGIAVVSGLPDVRLDELVRFEHGQVGFALTLERESLGCVLLDDAGTIGAGDRVRGTGEVVRVPVGPSLLGRIVDPLGRPLDGGGPIEAEAHEPVERPAPAIIDRDFVTSRCRPAFWSSIPCSRSDAASAS